jgi:hypothetical protein
MPMRLLRGLARALWLNAEARLHNGSSGRQHHEAAEIPEHTNQSRLLRGVRTSTPFADAAVMRPSNRIP